MSEIHDRIFHVVYFAHVKLDALVAKHLLKLFI
jgi:hypothetical protein